MSVQELADGSIFSVKHLRLGKKATTLTGFSVDGEEITLDEYRGKVILIDFWATWCAPCVASVPTLKSLGRELDETTFAIIGISADTDATQLQKVMKERGIDWPNILDNNEILQKKWQSLSLPTYYVLDQERIVRYRGNDHERAASVARAILGTGSMPQAIAVVKGIFDLYDKNQDQRLEDSEIPNELKAGLEAADRNNDKILSMEELAAFLRDAKVTTPSVNPTSTNLSTTSDTK